MTATMSIEPFTGLSDQRERVEGALYCGRRQSCPGARSTRSASAPSMAAATLGVLAANRVDALRQEFGLDGFLHCCSHGRRYGGDVITKDHFGTHRPRKICQIGGKVYQKVVDGNHPCELSVVLHYRQPSHSVGPKQWKRVPQLRVARNRDHRRSHHCVNSAVRRYPSGKSSSDEIAVGHNPDKSRAVYNGQ